MAIYLIDKKYSELGLNLAQSDEGAKIVLIQDGVYADVSSLAESRQVFYVENDAKRRGVEPVEGATMVSYADLIDMIDAEAVFNFV